MKAEEQEQRIHILGPTGLDYAGDMRIHLTGNLEPKVLEANGSNHL